MVMLMLMMFRMELLVLPSCLFVVFLMFALVFKAVDTKQRCLCRGSSSSSSCYLLCELDCVLVDEMMIFVHATDYDEKNGCFDTFGYIQVVNLFVYNVRDSSFCFLN